MKIDKILNMLNITNYSSNTKLEDLAIDSLKLMEIIVTIENTYNIEISDENIDFHTLQNVQDLESLIEQSIKN